MGMNIRVRIDYGDTLRELDAMALRSLSFRPVFEWARKELGRQNARNFSTGGLPVGGWDPVDPPDEWDLMRDTGALFNSLTTLTGPPNDIRDRSATFGTNIDYAPYHQAGTRDMPQREIIFEPRGFAGNLADKIGDYILGLDDLL